MPTGHVELADWEPVGVEGNAHPDDESGVADDRRRPAAGSSADRNQSRTGPGSVRAVIRRHGRRVSETASSSPSAAGPARPSRARWCPPPCSVLLLFSVDHAPLLGTLLARLTTTHTVSVAGQCVDSGSAIAPWVPEAQHAILIIDEALLESPQSAGHLDHFLAHHPPSVRLIIAASASDGFRDVNALVLGRVRGCLTIDAPIETYLQVIDAVCRGELWFPRCVLTEVIDRLLASRTPVPAAMANPDSADDVLLSPRELAIIALLREGLTNKEIARRLGISHETVKKHLKGAFERFGVHNRLQLLMQVGSQSQ